MSLFKIRWLFMKYDPSDRDLESSLISLKEDISNLKNIKKIKNKYNLQTKLSDVQLKEIIRINFLIDSKKFNIEDIFLGKFSSKDTINDLKVKAIIRHGFKLMKKSIDPVHDITHIIRTLLLAKFIYDSRKKELDWGVISTSIVWHDISRRKYLGFLYANSFERIKLMPVFQDLNLIEIYFKDATRSKMIVKDIFEKFGLPKQFIKRVGKTIQGTDTRYLNYKKYTLKKKYHRFISDVDGLDIFTIGRWESYLRNVIYGNLADRNFLNRGILLNLLYNSKKTYNKINFHISHEIFNVYATILLKHLKDFFPTDYKLAKKAFSEI